jgi:hypothetical protein
MNPIKAQANHDSVLTTLTNYLIVSGMLTCAAIGLVQVAQQVSPRWNAALVPVLVFCIALESATMTRTVRYHKLPAPWYALRAAEALMLFLIIRSLLGLLRGPQPAQPASSFSGYVDGELFALTVIAFVFWMASWLITENLLNLETIDPTLDRELIKDVAEAQANSRQSLISLILIIGGVLTFFAALIRIYLRTTDQTALAAAYGLWHVVIYFFLALLLLGRMRLSMLRAGWVWERIPLTGRVGGRWITYTLLMLVAAVMVAIVLPTQYSLGLLGTLGYLLSGLIQIMQAIIYFIAFLIVSFLSLFFPQIQAGKPLTGMLPKPTAPLDTSAAPPPSLSEFVQSLIFWAVFFVIVGYVLLQFFRRHPEMVEALKHIPGVKLLMRLWQRLRVWFGGLSQQFEDLREARRKARGAAPTRSASAPRRWINPRRLSPRQQVQFYYLAMLRRSSEKGHPRLPTQTPYEYARALERKIPEIDQDVDGLTDEFIEARYSRHDIPADHVGLVRRYWKRIKQALRRSPFP